MLFAYKMFLSSLHKIKKFFIQFYSSHNFSKSISYFLCSLKFKWNMSTAQQLSDKLNDLGEIFALQWNVFFRKFSSNQNLYKLFIDPEKILCKSRLIRCIKKFIFITFFASKYLEIYVHSKLFTDPEKIFAMQYKLNAEKIANLLYFCGKMYLYDILKERNVCCECEEQECCGLSVPNRAYILI